MIRIISLELMRNGFVEAKRNSSWEFNQNQSEKDYLSLVEIKVFYSWSSGRMLSWSVDKKACCWPELGIKSDAFTFFFYFVGELVTFVEVFDPVWFKLFYLIFP